MKAAVALGSNLGDRLANLKQARDAIAALPGVKSSLASSAVYETDPVECEADAQKFLNAVVAFDYEGGAPNLLQRLRAIEVRAGRSSARAKNTSRTLDLDLLFLGDLELKTNDLQLPHPCIAKRRFVLAPLADVCPDLTLPGHSRTVRELLRQLDNDGAVEPFSTQW